MLRAAATASLMAACLIDSAAGKSLTEAMKHIMDSGLFIPTEPPTHTTDVKVGVYLEHLLDVSIEEHTFDMDFYFTLEWMDARNYSSLFADENLVETEPDQCEEQRDMKSKMKNRKKNRNLLDLALPGNARQLAEQYESDEDFDPQVGDFVKYTAGDVTYTANVVQITPKVDDPSTMMYKVTYEDALHGVTQEVWTLIENLDTMPIPARKFVEFGHDELKLIWEPDIHITNLHQDMLTHEELLRVYDDGHVEFIRFVWAKLDMHEKIKIGYPVDTLMLETHIASLSHSTERITIAKHPTMNGLEQSLVKKWSAGWDYERYEYKVLDKQPDYAHADSCRQERRAVYIFDLFVTRPSAEDLTTKLDQLTFKATAGPSHLTDVKVGVFFEQVRAVDDKLHEFTSIFYTIYRWKDPRNYTILFKDPNFLETESIICSKDQHVIRNLEGSSRRLSSTEGRSEADERLRRVSRRLASSSASSPSDSSGSSAASSEENEDDAYTRRFVEFGHDERKLLWQPDLHVVNAAGEPQIHSELMRLYDDGWVEVIELQEGVLEMLHPDYISFPFDSQGLNVEVESWSHSSNRIILNPLDEMTGVELSMLKDWVAGWKFISEDHHAFLRAPDYTHGSACRGETMSRFDFHLVLEREGWKTVEQVLVPCTVLVLISFIAFYIDIKTLMPRIAVGFLTFLTMTNWEASTVETFASQEHPVWFIEFFKMMRLIVACTLWETCFSSFIGEKLSVRLSRDVDRKARLIFLIDYIIAITTISLMPKDEGGVLALNYFGYINAVCIILAIMLATLLLHRKNYNELIYDPLTVYHDTTEEMDTNEVQALYTILDKNNDEQVTVEQIVRALMVDMHKNSGVTDERVKRKQEAELVAICKKKLAEQGDAPPMLHRHAFEANYKSIFGEALAWKIRHDAVKKRGNSLLEMSSGAVKRMSGLLAGGSRKTSTMSTSSTDDNGYEYKVDATPAEVEATSIAVEYPSPSAATRKKKTSKDGFSTLESEREAEYAVEYAP